MANALTLQDVFLAEALGIFNDEWCIIDYPQYSYWYNGKDGRCFWVHLTNEYIVQGGRKVTLAELKAHLDRT